MPRTESQLPAGVREIDHTADLGMEVEAASLEELFQRAAAGMMALVRATDDAALEGSPGEPPASPASRSVRIELDGGESDVAALLVRWLRELLYLQEVAGFVYRDASFRRLDESGLRASVRPDPHASRQIRELKGVTYHGLEVVRTDDGWRARVIFDI